MNADIQGKIDAIKAPFQSVMDAADSIPALVDASELAKYNDGFQAGKDSIQLPAPGDPAAQYTQAQMDAAVSAGKDQQSSEDKAASDTVVAQLNAQIADFQNQLDAKTAQINALTAQAQKALADVEVVKQDLA